MKRTYIDIDWTDLNMNIEEDKRILHEVEEVLERYGYNMREFLKEIDRCVARYYHPDFIIEDDYEN